MKNDVQEYVKACPKCLVSNPKVSKEGPSLNTAPVPAKSGVWLGLKLNLFKKLRAVTSISSP